MIYVDSQNRRLIGCCKAKDFKKEMKDLEKMIKLQRHFYGEDDDK